MEVPTPDKVIRDGYIWTNQICPICGNAPDSFIGKRGGQSHREALGIEVDIWRCRKCDLLFPNPMPFPVDGLGQHYDVDADDYFKEHLSQGKLDSANEMILKAEKLLGRKGRLLDVGIGRGELLVAASDRGWEVEGVEPSATFADHAEARTKTKIWREPIERSDIAPEQFDVVILAAVLEHLYNPDEVLGKIARILKPGGLLYLDVPNESGLYFKIGNMYQRLRGRDWCVNLAPTFPPFHVFGFSPKSLKKLLNKHSLKPKHWRVYGGTSLVPSRGGLIGSVESIASKGVTAISNRGEMGTYIETWAVKLPSKKKQP